MYAVIETGGKQYRVEVGTELEVELLDASAGDSVSLDRVLLVADGPTATIGRPLVANASVAAEVVRQARGEKVVSFKYRPKARRRVKKGHRQELTVLRISDIVVDGRSAAAQADAAREARLSERQRLEEAARRQAEADAALAAKLAADKPAAPPKPKGGREATAGKPVKAPAGKAATQAEKGPAEAEKPAPPARSKGRGSSTAKAGSKDAEAGPRTRARAAAAKTTKATKPPTSTSGGDAGAKPKPGRSRNNDRTE
jgi:large subunit ribosomal protein L21